MPLSITSLPRGADLFIAGERKGETPITVQVAQQHPVTLEVRAHGYATATRTLTPGTRPAAQRFELEPLDFVLRVETVPPGATVQLPGKSLTSPGEVNLGHLGWAVTASISKTGYRSAKRPVRPTMFQLSEGKMRATVTINLAPLPKGAAVAPGPNSTPSPPPPVVVRPAPE